MKKQPPPIPAKVLHKAHAENMRLMRELINKLVKDSGLTKSEIARRMGVTHAYVCQVLNGQVSVTLLNVSKFLVVLNSRINIFFVGNKDVES